MRSAEDSKKYYHLGTAEEVEEEFPSQRGQGRDEGDVHVPSIIKVEKFADGEDNGEEVEQGHEGVAEPGNEPTATLASELAAAVDCGGEAPHPSLEIIVNQMASLDEAMDVTSQQPKANGKDKVMDMVSSHQTEAENGWGQHLISTENSRRDGRGRPMLVHRVARAATTQEFVGVFPCNSSSLCSIS